MGVDDRPANLGGRRVRDPIFNTCCNVNFLRIALGWLRAKCHGSSQQQHLRMWEGKRKGEKKINTHRSAHPITHGRKREAKPHDKLALSSEPKLSSSRTKQSNTRLAFLQRLQPPPRTVILLRHQPTILPGPALQLSTSSQPAFAGGYFVQDSVWIQRFPSQATTCYLAVLRVGGCLAVAGDAREQVLRKERDLTLKSVLYRMPDLPRD